jgi:hypothetical protein
MTAIADPPSPPLVRRVPAQFLRATATPARLRLLLVGLVVLCLAWGAAAAWAVSQHASAAADVVGTSEPLSLDAQQIYRSLSDANATEASAFLSGGLEPLAARRRYQADIAQADGRLEAATAAAGNSAAGTQLADLSSNLPVYAGEVATARADNGLGLPLGAAYLREASALMRGTLLPAARDLYTKENARLATANGQATGLPLIALAIVVALAIGYVLYRAQRWLSRRTHRRLNYGLFLASVAGAVSLCWLIGAFAVARADLQQAANHGSAPVETLAQADIAALQAHADESLTLIDDSGDDVFQADFSAVQKKLGPGPGTLLTLASRTAAGSPGAGPAAAAATTATAWYRAHRQVRTQDDSSAHAAAVRSAIGSGPDDSGALFRQLDTDLTGAISSDQVVFRSNARSGRDAFAGLEAGVIVLSIVMAAGCAWGLSRRLAEYR